MAPLPIFEFLCPACNRIFSFLSLGGAPNREPMCPRCGGGGLRRVPSRFAVAGRQEKPQRNESTTTDEGAAQRMEQEAMRMAGEIGENDLEDPRTMARMMRRLAESSGERVTPAMSEMFRRMEEGEDPEALEEELGPQLEEEMGEDDESGGSGGPSHDDGLYSL